jgi:hypothetical protein
MILEQNRILMGNTKNVLETFPKAVIIRGYSQNTNCITDLFVNDCAKQNILSDDMKFRVADPNDQNDDDDEDEGPAESYKTYSEVLEMHEGNLFYEDDDHEHDQIERVAVFSSSQSLSPEESKFYSVKTIRVTWEN